MLKQETRRIVRNVVRIAAIAGASALAGCGGSKTSTTTAPHYKQPAPKLETKATYKEVSRAVGRLSQQAEALAQFGIVRRSRFSFPVPCSEAPGQPSVCAKKSPQEIRDEQRINRHVFSADFAPDRHSNIGQDGFVSFKSSRTTPTGNPSIPHVYDFDMQSITRRPNGYYRLAIYKDGKLGGWDIAAEYAPDMDTDIQFCFNSAIARHTGQILPLTRNVLATLTEDGSAELAQYASGEPLVPREVPPLSGGRDAFLNGSSSGC